MATQTITKKAVVLGERYGKWLVKSAARRKGGHLFWECQCLSCNQRFTVRQDNLLNGKSRGCRQCQTAFGNEPQSVVSADGTVLYRSIHEASRKLGVDRTVLNTAIEQKRRIAGHIWQIKQPQEATMIKPETDPKRDPLFRVEVIRAIENPQQVAWFGMHQDYAEGFVADQEAPEEAEAGKILISHLLAGNRGHFGPLEHPQIVLNAGWFPHSCMQQIRTHRISISMDVQSGRYTGNRVVQAAAGELPIEQVFYFRPEGQYRDRFGKFYTYTEADIAADHATALAAAKVYANRLDRGWAEEHARDMLPFGVRQHWILSANARSLLHVLDLRAKADAQLECQQLCDLIWPHFEAWMPQVAGWYREKRWGKALLAP